MTARAAGVPSRGADAPTRTTWTRDGVGAVLTVLVLGLAFRLIFAQANPNIGLSFDLISFRAWADNLASEGLNGFYERPFFHDYTPGYLYVLWIVGMVGQAAGGIGDLIKIPSIIADVALGWLVWSMVREVGGSTRAALVGATLVVVNPVTWFDSVVWGQVDSFGLVFLLLGVRELWRDRPERAAIWTVIAALIKPQLGILVPVVAVVTIRRALWPSGGHGRPDEPVATAERDAADAPGARAGTGIVDRLRAWELRTDRPIRIVTTGLVAVATTYLLCLPFGLSVIELSDGGLRSGLLEQIFKTAGGYPYLTVNAFNPWALVDLNGNGLAATGGWVCDVVIPNPVPGGPECPVAFSVGPIPAVLIGTALLVGAFVVVCTAIAARPDRLTILVGVTLLAIAFFVLPTRVHERYMFPFFALGAVLAAVSWRWLIAYVVLSVAAFLNMYAVLAVIYPDPEYHTMDWLGIGGWLRDDWGLPLVAIANLVVALWAFAQLRGGARSALGSELVAPYVDDVDIGLPGPVAATGGGTVGAATAAFGAPSPEEFKRDPARAPGRESPPDEVRADVPLPRWGDPPSVAELGFLGWLRAKVSDRPVRADRSKELDREGTGRFDRLDLLLLVVLVMSVLGLRTFRLAEPYQMHFDEVYHARTATEFLQHWRYGISHDIYEWTHPHLAKYAMAGGLVAWGDDRVSATSELGVTVVDAAIEPRRDDPSAPGGRAGDRVHLATGSEVRSYDLATREPVFARPVDGASAVEVDTFVDRLFIGTSEGQILTFELIALDDVRSLETSLLVGDPVPFGSVDGAITSLYATDDGRTLLVATDDDRLVALDATSSEIVGSSQLEDIAAFAPAGSGPAVTLLAEGVGNPGDAAAIIADLLGGDAVAYETRLREGGEGTVIAGFGGVDERANIQAAIDDGRLAGVSIEDVPRIAVATADGVTFVSSATGDVLSTTALDGGAHGLALATFDDARLYVSTGGAADGAPGEIAVVVVAGDQAANGPTLQRTMPLPGRGATVFYNEASQMIHVLGTTPDGTASTIYVIEPHADPGAVFADARLPFEPAALALDVAKPYPSDDRQQILAFESDGSVASVETGKHAFAWRLPGVIAGALMAALVYLLGRILFRRREVAVLAGVFVLLDGMLFVQSRIGMNDAYVALGIVAAYTVFAAIWTGKWRRRGAFWLAIPIIGVSLGFALAAKWVALYAIGGLGILVLVRSALGRLLLIAGLVVMTGLLGHLALVDTDGGIGNMPFVVIMIALTSIAVVVNVLHPIAWSDDEMRFAVAAPAALGVLAGLAAVGLGVAGDEFTVGPIAVTPLHLAAALIILSVIVYVGFVVAGRAGFGPLAARPDPTDPAALLPPPARPSSEAWLRPGALLGLPIAWMVVWLAVVPIAMYVVSYIPWALVEGHRLTDTWPTGHEGQTLIELTRAMYSYHNDLAVGHAASSPWWAWPFDLKPVWFYQEGFAGSTTAAIYDAGNLAIWWLGVPAMGFVAWQAYARRSLGLALIAIAFACQWVSWARIDRAAFQYHYYTSLPFLILALAYFVAEIWHGASRRTWLLARVAAAVAIMGPGLLWLFGRPLCGFVGVGQTQDPPFSQACPPAIPELVVTVQAFGLAVVVLGGIGLFVWQLSMLDRSGPGSGRSFMRLAPLIATAAGTLIGILIVPFLPQVPIISTSGLPVEPLAMIGSLPLLLLAAFIVTARDARRFVAGFVTAAAGWFLVFYPNISALPLPSVVANAYQGVLPTYLYLFQFPSNRTEVPKDVALLDPVAFLIAAGLTLLCVVLAYSAWLWRIALAERAADEALPPPSDRPDLPAPAAGG